MEWQDLINLHRQSSKVEKGTFSVLTLPKGSFPWNCLDLLATERFEISVLFGAGK